MKAPSHEAHSPLKWVKMGYGGLTGKFLFCGVIGVAAFLPQKDRQKWRHPYKQIEKQLLYVI